jgi:hypothetical protein
MSGETIGMMDQAFFVGRKEILNFVNDFLELVLILYVLSFFMSARI